DCEIALAGSSSSGVGNEKARSSATAEPADCWFCLSTPKLLTHLLVSISSECYLSIPRGPIVRGGHYIAVTVGHYPSHNHLLKQAGVSDAESTAARSQVEAYLKGIRSMEFERGNSVVSFEIFGGGGGSHGGPESKRVQHYHVQSLSIPSEKALDFETALRDEAERAGLKVEEGDDALPVDVTDPYIRFMLPVIDPAAIVRQIVLTPRADAEHISTSDPVNLPPRPSRSTGFGPRINVQFGGLLLAKFLGVPERADWRKCVGTEEEETAECEEVKARWGTRDDGIE
ncbi:hypothetical protein HDU93_004023, partial [Gonapodya sp. JEL0774]